MEETVTVDPGLERFTSGHELAVDVATIEQELASLWKKAAEGSSQAAPVMRACLWNVVVRATDEAACDEADRRLTQVSPGLPMRAIVLRLEPEGPGASIQAWISANCHLAEGGTRKICSEEITIAATGSAVADVPPVVLALLSPDVPSALWWLGDPPGGIEPHRTLLEAMDRVWVEGSGPGWCTEIGAFASLLRLLNPAPLLVDMAWLRLLPWRLASAGLFDRSAAQRELRSLRRIHCTTGPGNPWEGALHAGWLRERTGVAAEVRFGTAERARAGTAEWARAGALAEVILECAETTFRLSVPPGERRFLAEARGGQAAFPPRSVPFEPPDATSLVADALGSPGADPLFAAALPHAVSLLREGDA